MMNSEYSRVAPDEDGVMGSGGGKSLMADEDVEQNPSLASAVPMIKVSAPAMLPEGYEMQVDIGNGRLMKVKVPKGGVAEGQLFEVPLEAENIVPQSSGGSSGVHDNKIHIPVGHWRDGICACFNYGICHPHCWTGFCGLVAAGQVISRLNLKWDGRESNTVGDSAGSFSKILAFVIGYWFFRITLYMIGSVAWPSQDDNETTWVYSNAFQVSQEDGVLRFVFKIVGFVLLFFQKKIRICLLYVVCLVSFYWAIKFMFQLDSVFVLASYNNDAVPYTFLFASYIYDVLDFCFTAGTFVILRNVREYVRQKYSIPVANGCCNAEIEDCACSTFCHWCVACQLLRHTGDYDKYPAQCCSSTGMPAHIKPAIL